MGLKTLVLSYLLGGLTLPPLLLMAAFYLLFVWLPKPIGDMEEARDDDLSEFAVDEYQKLKLTEIEEKESIGVRAFRAGWLTVTREYHPFIVNASDKQLEQKNPENKSAYTALYKLVKSAAKKRDSNQSHIEPEQDPPTKFGNTNQAVSKAVRKKNRYYGVLRHGNLFLYKDENKKDVQHVIVLSNNIVTIWPRNLSDAELFTKKSSICVLKKKSRRKSDVPPRSSSASLSGKLDDESTLDILEKNELPSKNMGFFIYPETNYEKEDWYFDLIKATKRENYEPTGSEFDTIEASVYANPLHFKTADIISLIQTLHSSEGQLQTRWLNAIIGRLFLSLQSTEYFENMIRNRILKKLDKINKPGFLDDFEIKKVDVGNSAPFISSPKLVELNPDGSTKVSVHFSYRGKISLQVATKLQISLGGAFRNREFSLLLAVTLDRLEGPLLIHMKSPPSSRFWYTFEEMPDMDLTVEPVVSQRQFSYSMVNNIIEGKLRSAVKESLVKPYWDDVTFFNTSDEFYRGGIWDTKKRPESESNTHQVNEEDKEVFNDEFPVGETESVVEPDLGSESAVFFSDSKLDQEDSLRPTEHKSIKTKPSFSSLEKKSKPYTETSNDQFLANGSYVSRSPTLDAIDDEKSVRKLISEEASVGKKTISNGLKKIGKWYAEKNKSSASVQLQKQETSSYKPPEMISKRRAPSNTSIDANIAAQQLKSNTKSSVSSLSSIGSSESSISPSSHKSAPQAHSFPAEYMYGLNTRQPDDAERSSNGAKNLQPSKIPEMKSPYVLGSDFFSNDTNSTLTVDIPTSPKKLNLPKRKSVQTDEVDSNAAKSIAIGYSGSEDLKKRPPPPELPERTHSLRRIPPVLPARKAPPPLPSTSKEEPSFSSSTQDTTPSQVSRPVSEDSSKFSIPPTIPPRETEDVPTSAESISSANGNQYKDHKDTEVSLVTDGSEEKIDITTKETSTNKDPSFEATPGLDPRSGSNEPVETDK